jgi:hypothetical protein
MRESSVVEVREGGALAGTGQNALTLAGKPLLAHLREVSAT